MEYEFVSYNLDQSLLANFLLYYYFEFVIMINLYAFLI